MERKYEVTWENLQDGSLFISELTAGQMDELMYLRRHSHRVVKWSQI
jgi:hypothetical protein